MTCCTIFIGSEFSYSVRIHAHVLLCMQTMHTHWLSPLRTINFPKMTTHLMSVKTSIRFFNPYK